VRLKGFNGRPPNSPLVPFAAALFIGCSLLQPREKIFSSSIRDLREGTYTQREIAVLRLAKVGAPAVPDIIQVLGEKDDDARYFAVRALGRMGEEGERAIPTLIAMLRDDELTIPSSTAEAVAAMGPAAVVALQEAAGDTDDGLRYWTAYALGRTKPASAGARVALVGMLDDPYPAVRSQATASLVRIGRPAVPDLISGLDRAPPASKSLTTLTNGELRSPPSAAPEILAALSEIGGPEALEEIRKRGDVQPTVTSVSAMGETEEMSMDDSGKTVGISVVPAADQVPAGEPIPPQVESVGPTGLPVLAVADLSAQGVSASDAAVATDWLRSELVSTRRITVVERAEMERVLAEHAFQRTGCTSEDCAIKLGRLLNVNRMVLGSFGKFIKSYVMNVRVVDVETGRVVYSAMAKGGTEEEIGAAVRDLASRIASNLDK
jgi:HEAT repeat protein